LWWARKAPKEQRTEQRSKSNNRFSLEELWVPQGTTVENEEAQYEEYFEVTSRFNQLIVQASSGDNVLTQENHEAAMQMHLEIETRQATVDGEQVDLVDLRTKSGGNCVSSSEGVCQCLITSILRQWNYDL